MVGEVFKVYGFQVFGAKTLIRLIDNGLKAANRIKTAFAQQPLNPKTIKPHDH